MSRWSIRRLFVALTSMTVVAFVVIAATVFVRDSSERRLRQENAAAAKVRAELYRIQYLGSQFVLYQTAMIEDGRIRFVPDAYGWDAKLTAALVGARPYAARAAADTDCAEAQASVG